MKILLVILGISVIMVSGCATVATQETMIDGKLTITEAERPVLDGPDELLIKAAAVGVCGSEVHAFRGTHPFRKPRPRATGAAPDRGPPAVGRSRLAGWPLGRLRFSLRHASDRASLFS